MGQNSAIEWTDHTFNPWIGCTEVSPGCVNCYARVRMQDRFHRVKWGKGQPRQLTKTWDQPPKWNAEAERSGVRKRVFCASLADVFDAEAPDEWREMLWELIEDTPWLDWQILTKRIESAVPMWGLRRWPDNVWLGATVENAAMAAKRLPILSRIHAAVRFVSAEPLLEAFDLGDCGIDWLICGGESGKGARPMSPDDARWMRDQCNFRRIPFFFKQWGGATAKAGGRLLDGREWAEVPDLARVL